MLGSSNGGDDGGWWSVVRVIGLTNQADNLIDNRSDK